MKRLVFSLFFLFFTFPLFLHATDMWLAEDFIGGTSGCLDALYSEPSSGHTISVGDTAIVINGDRFYTYTLEDIGGTEDSPLLIDPDNASAGTNWRWVLNNSAMKKHLYDLTTTQSLTSYHCCSGNITNTGATGVIVLTLRPAIVGMNVHFSRKADYNFDVNPNGSETIRYITNSAGDAVRLNALGSFLTLVCEEVGYWTPKGRLGVEDVN